MTGIVNSTGARSGIIGTTVGSPSPTNAADIGSGVLPVGVTGGSGLNALTFPAGHILQVVQQTWNDLDTSSSATFDIPTNGSCAITPLDVNSHFLVSLHTQLSASGGSAFVKVGGTAAATTTTLVSPVGVSGVTQTQTTAGGHHNASAGNAYAGPMYSLSFIHDPALSNLNTIYYNMLFANYYTSSAMHINRAFQADTGSYMAHTSSSIIVQEISRAS